MTCKSDPLVMRRWIDQWNPVSIEQIQNSFTITVATEEQALDLVNGARTNHALQRFEISRTSLEDTFIELIDKKTGAMG